MLNYRIAKEKEKTGRHCKSAATKGLIFFQSKLDLSNFKVFVAFSADEHSLNCSLRAVKHFFSTIAEV